MAAAATKKNQQTPPAVATTVDPKFEWAEKAGSFVLHLALPGFRKDDFRVQVDGAGRLTVRGARPAATGPGSLHKVFQLPSAAIHDDIIGRFEAGMLTLTVPKRASLDPAPTSIEEIKTKPTVARETKPKEEEITKEDALKKKAIDEATKKAHHQKQQEEEANKSKQEQQKPAPAQVKKEEVKPKGPQAASTQPPQKPVKREEEMKPKSPQAAAATPPPEKPAPKREAATGDEKGKAAVATEGMADRVRRRSEDERVDAATMAEAKRAKMDGEKKARAECVGWKERVQGELKVLTEMKWTEGLIEVKWADGVVEAARKNKEVVAVGVAAFSLGFLVSHKLFRK